MNWEGLHVGTHEDVYRPSDDTFLLCRAVAAEVRRGDHFLEVGCGTGLVGLVAWRAGARVTLVDRSPVAARLAAQNARANAAVLDVVCGDLLDGLAGPFDVVAFNPPYLPTAPEDVIAGPLNLAFDGGPDGNRTVLRFAAGAAAWTTRPRTVLVVHSSLSDPAPLDEAMAAAGFAASVVMRERLPYEELTVRCYRPSPAS